MNAVEIEEAVSSLAEAPFDAETFPFDFLEAFGNKPTTLKKLQSTSGSSNQSDLPGGVLQRNNIHLKVCAACEVTTTLLALRDSPATARYKAKFILATDGQSFEAENLADGETIACEYPTPTFMTTLVFSWRWRGLRRSSRFGRMPLILRLRVVSIASTSSC
jgi:hypothetical protein